MLGISERLERDSIPEPNSGCLLWMGATTKGGYANLGWKGRTRYGHHLAYEAKTGHAVPRGVVIRHKCDVRCCVNGDHVLSGTHKDNTADMFARGRQWPAEDKAKWWKQHGTRGAEHPNAKLSHEQRERIVSDKRPQSVIAAEYGVSQGTVSRTKGGRHSQ